MLAAAALAVAVAALAAEALKFGVPGRDARVRCTGGGCAHVRATRCTGGEGAWQCQSELLSDAARVTSTRVACHSTVRGVRTCLLTMDVALEREKRDYNGSYLGYYYDTCGTACDVLGIVLVSLLVLFFLGLFGWMMYDTCWLHPYDHPEYVASLARHGHIVAAPHRPPHPYNRH